MLDGLDELEGLGMKKHNQALSNPYPHSDTNKRYYTYDYYLKQTFGGKCAKIPLDAGLTCPNIDGRCGYGGCIYCSGRGSGDFAASPSLSIEEQYQKTKDQLSRKWSVERCIPYFQAHTNTYADLVRLHQMFDTALTLPGAVGLNIATRADCLPPDVVDYLPELSEKGKKNEEQFRTGMQKMSTEEKMNFVDTLFDLVSSTGAETLTDFADGGIKKLVTLVKGYGGLDKQKRDLMLALILKLFDFKKERSDA